jgi:hypothetical protein
MRRIFQNSLLLMTLVTGWPAMAQPLDVDTVLERLLASYGGEEKLRKLESQVQEWDFVALMGNRHGTDIRSVRAPDRLRVELSYPDKKETRILNGAAGHVVFNDTAPRVAAAAQRDAMRLQLMRLYSPLTLRKKRSALSLTVEGGFTALSLVENGLRADYLVNTDNWRIEKVVGTLNVNGAEMAFLTEYSDFRFRDGVLIHHKENKFAGGVNTAMLQLRNVTFEAELPEGTFQPQAADPGHGQ